MRTRDQLTATHLAASDAHLSHDEREAFFHTIEGTPPHVCLITYAHLDTYMLCTQKYTHTHKLHANVLGWYHMNLMAHIMYIM